MVQIQQNTQKKKKKKIVRKHIHNIFMIYLCIFMINRNLRFLSQNNQLLLLSKNLCVVTFEVNRNDLVTYVLI